MTTERPISYPSPAARAAQLRAELLALIADNERQGADACLRNPVAEGAVSIAERLGDGRLSLIDTGLLAQHLCAAGFEERVRRLSSYVGEMSAEANRSALEAAIERLAERDGHALPFAEFRDKVERSLAGIVLTAHPTFGVSRELSTMLGELASGCTADGHPLSDAERERRLDYARRVRHMPDEPITLTLEQHFAESALANLRTAVHALLHAVLAVAQRRYPDDWTRLKPAPVTLATWVGFDVDGRNDIGWRDMLRCRFDLALLQCSRLLDDLRAITDVCPLDQDHCRTLASVVGIVDDRLGLTLEAFREAQAIVCDPKLDALAVAERLSKHLERTETRRCRGSNDLVEWLGSAVEACDEQGLKRALAVLRAEVAMFGLGLGHIHVRLNSSQVHNAIRPLIGMEGQPDDPANRRRYMTVLSGQLDQVEAEKTTLADLEAERMSARRVIMTIAQMLSLIDRDTPVRLLIAEADTPFTTLAALYLCRFYGIADKVDISPLFETATALERGAAVIDELLANPHYRAYVLGRRRLAIQTGYSDAGRYLGQTAASMAIERLKIKLAQAMYARGASGLELVLFDTHGESIGRGSHPDGLVARIDYLSPLRAWHAFASAGIPVKQEISFQGGDGFTLFATPALALAVVTRLVCTLAGRGHPPGDAFYTETDFSLDFFLGIAGYNERLMDNADFATLLMTWGGNMLYRAGSRATKRQSEGKPKADAAHPSQMRAIPQNALLQQVGFLANSLGGVGAAIARDPERFAEVLEDSPRLTHCMRLVRRAAELSRADVLASYTGLFDPNFWMRRARGEGQRPVRRAMLRISQLLEQDRRWERLARVSHEMAATEMTLQEGLAWTQLAYQPLGIDEADAAGRDMILLHVLRLGLMQHLFTLAARVPQFSTNPDYSPDQILLDLMGLDVEHALSVLRGAFPPSPKRRQTGSATPTHGYDPLHADLFDPMASLYDQIRTIGVAITHRIGALG